MRVINKMSDLTCEEFLENDVMPELLLLKTEFEKLSEKLKDYESLKQKYSGLDCKYKKAIKAIKYVKKK